MDARIAKLFHHAVEQELTSEQACELDEKLRTDAAAADALARLLQIHFALAEREAPVRAFSLEELRAIDAVDKRFDAVDKRFQAVDQRFDAMDARFDAMDRRFDTVDARADRTDVRVDRLEARFDRVDERFDALQHLIVRASVAGIVSMFVLVATLVGVKAA